MVDAQELRRIFSQNIKDHLKKRRINQRTFAALIPVTDVTLSKWIHCQTTPNFFDICKVANALEVEPGSLFELQKTPPLEKQFAQALVEKSADERLKEEFESYKKFKRYEQFFANSLAS